MPFLNFLNDALSLVLMPDVFFLKEAVIASNTNDILIRRSITLHYANEQKFLFYSC